MSEITRLAREQRNNPTKAEKFLWQSLRNNQLGKRFTRQKPFIFPNYKQFFIADFYCKQANLIVEIDGGIHQSQKEYDQLRDKMLNQLGATVIRFSNEEVFKDMTKTLKKISSYL
jgi:very-short-patch-repair endonuclease